MIVDRHGHHLFGMFLPDHIFIQRGLDFMGRRNLCDVYRGRRLLFFRLFLLQLLTVSHKPGKVGEIDHTNARHFSGGHAGQVIH